jgi:hypothetical protein
MVVMLGMLQAIILASDVTLKNVLRDTAVKVSQEQLEGLRNSVAAGDPNLANVTTAAPFQVSRQVRNASASFTVTRTVNTAQIAAGAGNSKWVDLKVTWQYRGTQYSYNASTIIRPQ